MLFLGLFTFCFGWTFLILLHAKSCVALCEDSLTDVVVMAEQMECATFTVSSSACV